MLTLTEIKRKKEECHYTNRQLSMLSGVPLGTVQKVMGNVTGSPRYETLKALSAVFEESERRPNISYTEIAAKTDKNQICHVGEPETAYQFPRPVLPNPLIAVNRNTYDRQGTYTLEDYLALPDDQRVELIDGIIYDMGAPTSPHQLIGGEVYRQISNYIRERKDSCVPFIAPTDVQLDCDNRTIVQPDVMVVCDRSRINRRRILGAPDFVLEVLSPATRNKDIFIKSAKYMQAGVKEYWMVDPMKKTVMTYDMRIEDDPEMHMYTFDDKVPLALYDGDLVVDFKEIADYISFIPDQA